MKNPFPHVLPLLVALGLLAGLRCSPPNPYISAERSPGSPRILSVQAATLNDTVPCIKVTYTDTNTLPVTFRVDRTSPGGSVYAIRRYGIPANNRSFYDVPYPDSNSQDYNKYYYRMYAVSSDDSLSPPSNTDSITLLATQPAIDSIDTSAGYPVVHYRISGLWGEQWVVEIVKNDSLLAASGKIGPAFSGVDTTCFFYAVSIDSLRARKNAHPADNGVYGVRIRVELGDKVALEVRSFTVGN